MKDKKVTVMEKVRPNLLLPPHVVDKLIDLIVDGWHPDPAQQEQLVSHLAECPHCRITLIVLLSIEQEYAKLNNYPEASARDLLTQFVTLHHQIQAQDYEYIGAYAEAIVAQGREEADKRFPTLAEHITKCPGCQSILEETVAFLNEP